MNQWIDYVDAGGLFAWLAALAGAAGVLTVLFAITRTYKRPSAVLAIELSLAALALGGVGWFVNKGKADEARRYAAEKLGGAPQVHDRPRSTAKSEVAAEVHGIIEAEAADAVMRPVQVAVRAGGASGVLGLLLLLAAKPQSGPRSMRGRW